MKKRVVISFLVILTILITVIVSIATTKSTELTYPNLKKHGIVSGFGISDGHPLQFRNRIPRIDQPIYIPVRNELYPPQQLCVGIKTVSGWSFSPISILNSREIVYHEDDTALCYCPLAGLSIAITGDITISGLLKYDTFILCKSASDEMILPFTQTVYPKDQFIPLKEVQLLNFIGVITHFPNAKILDPQKYSQRNPYGDYSTSDLQGIGHNKPGLKTRYDSANVGFHPKEMVLIAGFDGKLQKAYPFKELKASVPSKGGSFEDRIEGQKITVSFDPQYQWANATETNGQSLNLAYTYIFSMVQHLPNIPIYRKFKSEPKN